MHTAPAHPWIDSARRSPTNASSRLAAVARKGAWALKGGQALLARLDSAARATKDADATWRVELARLDDMLEEAVDIDLGDGFRFEVGAARPMTAETDEGGLRYPVLALLDGREFERLQLDVNAVPDDRRPLEQLRLRDLLGFAGIEPPTVPVIPIAQHLAEKLHAYVRDHDIPWTDLDEADQALQAFWQPLLIGDQGSDNVSWDPKAWAWSVPNR